MQTRPARESTAAITRCMPIGAGQRAGEVVIDHLRELAVGGAAEQARSGDHRLRARGDQFLRAPHAADAAADPAGQPRRDLVDQRVVVAARHRGVEIDQLHLRKLRELLDPAVEIVGGNGELVALHELHDAATLEIDRRNQHALSYPDRDALTLEKRFQVADALLVEVEDRRRKRGVGVAGAEHLGEVFEACRRHLRRSPECSRHRTPRRSCRNRTRPWSRRDRSRSAESRRRRGSVASRAHSTASRAVPACPLRA